jgi:hypothetical protein
MRGRPALTVVSRPIEEVHCSIDAVIDTHKPVIPENRPGDGKTLDTQVRLDIIE